MIFAATALAAQVALAPCTIEGVPGQALCGTYKVWENRDARRGRQIGCAANNPAPPFLLSGPKP